VSLIVRLVLIGVVAVLVQITAISQISLLGVSADLTPLIVASVGLLAGSIPGAIMGFGMGLFVDTALVQTLGVDSLLLTGIGYGAGRLHEVRDPSHTLVPIAVGAAATAISQIGFALIQFLLGVDAPVSWLLLREILFTIAVNTVIALPVYALVRRLVAGALPEDPRRRRARRAASVTGGLSPLSQSASPRRRRRGLRAT
jgi:rod shape-determining protein MreD